MNLRILRSILLGALLLLMQVAASSHALTHFQDEHPENLSRTGCTWCSSYASLDGPPQDAPPYTIPPATFVKPASLGSTEPRDLPLQLAYRSQAPPRSS